MGSLNEIRKWSNNKREEGKGGRVIRPRVKNSSKKKDQLREKKRAGKQGASVFKRLASLESQRGQEGSLTGRGPIG